MTSIRRLVLCTALCATAVSVAAPTVEAATSMSVTWNLASGYSYALGVDQINTAGGSPGGYEKFYEYPFSLNNNNQILPNPLSIYSQTNLSLVRLEFYRSTYGQLWDPVDGDAGVTVRMSPSPSAQNIGTVVFPQVGGANTGRFSGSVTSSTTVTNGRVRFEIFQHTGQPVTNTGYPLDSFTAMNSVGNSYTTGPLWNGEYIAFITDTATGRQAVGFIDLAGNTDFDIDLDIVCFGIDECQWTGSIPNATGEFHALSPTRIVDSRSGLGIPSRVKPGDGRNSDPNPIHRMDSRLNHEFRVTGVGGVPSTGVSAVLLNVTVTGGTSSGSLRLFPKPPRSYVYGDQNSYPASNNQPPAVYWNTGEARATLQLMEVGVGGRVRLDNVSFGEVHVVVDVLGWVDQGQPGQDGSRLLTINPTRFLDTRTGAGGPQEAFAPLETRTLQVSARDGVPTTAEAVVGTITSVNAAGRSFQTAWPTGATMPVASVLNSIDGQVRPNLASVAVGEDGQWDLYNYTAGTDLIFDAVGYFTTAQGSGGDITAVPAAVAYGPTLFGANDDRLVTVTNKGGVPASGVSAVWVLLTSTGGSTRSYVTAYPNGTTRPNASNLNWVAGQSVANLALVPVGSNGAIRVFNANGSAAITVTILGWVN